MREGKLLLPIEPGRGWSCPGLMDTPNSAKVRAIVQPRGLRVCWNIARHLQSNILLAIQWTPRL